MTTVHAYARSARWRMSAGILFPSHGERVESDNHLTTTLFAANLRVQQSSVTPTFDRDVFEAERAAFGFRNSVPFRKLLDWTIAQMEHGVLDVNHPRCLGLFNPAPTFPAQCADRIAARFNPQLATRPSVVGR